MVGKSGLHCYGLEQGLMCVIGASQFQKYRPVQAEDIDVSRMGDEHGTAFMFRLFQLTGTDQAKYVIDGLPGASGLCIGFSVRPGWPR